MISTPCSRTVPNRTATQLVPTRPHRPPMSRRSPTICIKASLRPSKTYQRSLRGSQKHHSLNAPQHPAPSSNPLASVSSGVGSDKRIIGMSLVVLPPFSFLKISDTSAAGIMLFSRIKPGVSADEASRIVSSPLVPTLISKSEASIAFRTVTFSGSGSAINSNCFDCERFIF